MQVSLSIILDTRRIKSKSQKYPVKLRVIHKRVTEDYQLIYDLTKEEFNKLKAPRINEELQEIRTKIRHLEVAADAAACKLKPFNFLEFERDFIVDNDTFRKRKAIKKVADEMPFEFDFAPYEKKFKILKEPGMGPEYLGDRYCLYIKKLLMEERVGSAISYLCAYNSLIKFRGNVRLPDIGVVYLTMYERAMKEVNTSRTTIGIYLRTLRCIFNEAIADEIIERKKCYPFGKRKYQIPTSKNIKKALDNEDMRKIFNYKPENESEEKSRDFWIFCYYGNGMNIKDVSQLKYSNVSEGWLVFERAKTERTMRTDPKPITVFLTDEMLTVIEKWGNKDKSPDNFIFPILLHGLNILRQYDLIQFFIHFINENMKAIRDKLGIQKKITTYVARHTFSTILKRSGVSTEYISEALGHKDIKTTENYLGSFEKGMVKDYAGRLNEFKKI